MPMNIGNHELYQDRTVQDWHRRELPSSFMAIDVDLVGVCEFGYCRDPLYFIEATTNPDKPSTIIRKLAAKCGAIALLVFHDTDRITGFRVVEPANFSMGFEVTLSDLLNGIRVAHNQTVHRM